MWRKQTVKEKELLENCKWFWNKTESIIEKKFATQPIVDWNVCDGGDDLKIKFMRLSDFANDTLQKNSYRIDFWFMTKIQAVHKNVDQNQKRG